MIPPRVAAGFAGFPNEITELCRPHSWDELTRRPSEGMRSIRDILVHLISTEVYWIDYVIHGRPRRRFDPTAFHSLEEILEAWTPQRKATLAIIETLKPDVRLERRPFPWNPDESASIEEIVWHIVTHEQYHRGQIFTRLALLGRRDLPDHDLLR
jgi:uncharacterized damage-inducible protein DinB